MIGKLKGFIEHVAENHIILDVNGVGYLVFISSKTIQSIQSVSHKVVSLFIDTQVKEDEITLYGFIAEDEKNCFAKLISVKGVGPKLALIMLSYFSPVQIFSFIVDKNKDALGQISGIGKKIAERIITELKDCKIADTIIRNSKIYQQENEKTINKLDDTASALFNLGYNKMEAYRIGEKILDDNPNISVHDLIRLSLQRLSK
ncbi:Holliday junction branch migration protein RuvA [Rickettsia endosymbiont of Cardiosporidium cionae]|uniref:Holliday junction branch migration protein RuvA n=1 Tax=Rickettsia endosymbiont of Cardiosporidium cionae TaxID=2777155 RepID=UPI0018930B07|nr:Holliday junction branch migration protein RuvA [Rickettsia endosymbiont of Cardiosporidium cionae]KAF8818028.1 Holliday junction branch migration protein RuvA [Rickettsia endosymbiont of Cardiosporidium cionae]